ncbi:M1 family metallopeptidase [Sungkyunkwania multivorans]|uniref:Aminopeptidase N n=1 Tax=Sungkyunkwania multivorans TaxID=1173618 RepID=A0ABW3CV27_9FLAO
MKRFLLFFLLLIGSWLQAQQLQLVDFTKAHAEISIDAYQKKVFGTVTYQFDVFQKTKEVFLDAKSMTFASVYLNGRKVKFKNNGDSLIVQKRLKPGAGYELAISYEAYPKKAMYFIGWNKAGRNQVWTQGQGKESSHWIPSFDDVNEKVEFDLSVTFDKHYSLVANGKLIATEEDETTKTWHYDMNAPMSSYLLAIAVGKYDKKVSFSDGGTPLEMYYYPEDEDLFEPTYRYTKQIFDLIEAETLTAYPWQNYKQVPVKDFLYAGMENTSATIFSDSFVVDSLGFIDRNYVNVNAHEMAHQWFGDLVTAKSGKHHWLQEGFATYYALLAEKELFGDHYFYGKLYESSQDLMAQQEAGKATSLLDPNASSLTFYQKGAWVLHVLREVVGEEVFRTSVKEYLDTFKFQNVETDDFLAIVEKQSDLDLSAFSEKWIRSKQLKEKDLIKYLPLQYLLLCEFREFDAVDVIKRYDFALDGVHLAQDKKILEYLSESSMENSKGLYAQVLQSDNILLRQAAAFSLDTIPMSLKKDFEGLLEDPSYRTVEHALYQLWSQFPKERATYLKQTKDIIGFKDKNVRLLWLTLALVTPEFELAKKSAFYEELTGYTSKAYGFEVRQGALQYLYQIQGLGDQNLIDLLDACLHHNWRFASFARGLLKEMLKNARYKERFVALEDELPYNEQLFLKKQLTE